MIFLRRIEETVINVWRWPSMLFLHIISSIALSYMTSDSEQNQIKYTKTDIFTILFLTCGSISDIKIAPTYLTMFNVKVKTQKHNFVKLPPTLALYLKYSTNIMFCCNNANISIFEHCIHTYQGYYIYIVNKLVPQKKWEIIYRYFAFILNHYLAHYYHIFLISSADKPQNSE